MAAPQRMKSNLGTEVYTFHKQLSLSDCKQCHMGTKRVKMPFYAKFDFRMVSDNLTFPDTQQQLQNGATKFNASLMINLASEWYQILKCYHTITEFGIKLASEICITILTLFLVTDWCQETLTQIYIWRLNDSDTNSQFSVFWHRQINAHKTV